MSWSRALQLGFSTAVLGALLLVPVSASAGAVTYTSPANPSTGQSDFGDLDHHFLYAWRITDASLQGKTITGAVLTFNHLQNWDTNTNALYVDLLDTSYTIGQTSGSSGLSNLISGGTWSNVVTGWGPSNNQVTTFMDDPNPNSNSGALRDDFVNNYDYSAANGDVNDGRPAYHQAPGWIAGANVTTTALTSKTFVGIADPNKTNVVGTAYDGGTALPGEIDPTGWQHQGSNGIWTNTSSADAALSDGTYNYRYTFQSGADNELQALMNAIAAGGDFVIGLDADCHFFNTGVSLQLTFADQGVQAADAVPEPATLLLLGTGLVFASRYRRKTRKKKQS